MNFRPKLIATDLDGTIVAHYGAISQRTIDVFRKARAMGIQIFFVTGRPPRWMPEIKDAFGIGSAICGNGANKWLLNNQAAVRKTLVNGQK